MLLALGLLGCLSSDDDAADSGLPTVEPAAADAGGPYSVLVGEALSLSAGASVGERFQWTLGPGEVVEGAEVSEIWDAPGNFTVTLQAFAADGTWRSDAARVTVYEPLLATPPQRSATMAIDSVAGVLWAVTPEAGTVSVVPADGSPVEVLEACAGARSVAIADAVVFVACEEADALAVFDRLTHERTDLLAFDVGSRPVSVAATPTGAMVALAGTHEVVRIAGGVVSTRTAVHDPRALAVGPDGVWVTQWRADADGGAITRLGDERTPLADAPGPDSDTANRGVANVLEALAYSPSGKQLIVGGVHANTKRGLVRDGERLTHDTASRGMFRSLAVSGEGASESLLIPLDDLDATRAVAFDPLGTTAWLLHPGARHASQIDVFTGDVLRGFETGLHHATDLTVSQSGDTLFVHGWLDRVVVAFDVSVASAPPVERWRSYLVHEEPLDAQVLRGKQVFFDSWDTRMSQDAYLHCGSCHPDGRQDGLVWDFTQRGEGLRNTISLLGRAGTDHGRVHWTGNFDEIQDFEHDIRGGQGGIGFLPEEVFATVDHPLGAPKVGLDPDLDALAAYVSSLAVLPPSPLAEPELGEATFLASGCADCHPAPRFTDSSLDDPLRHDVGTISAESGQRLGGDLDGFDTPTLLGVVASAPYLHDGSAPTVEDAIDAHVPGFDGDQLALLADYVRSL